MAPATGLLEQRHGLGRVLGHAHPRLVEQRQLVARGGRAAGAHSVEVDWRRATGPDANDGGLQLWIDGASVADLTGLDNAASGIDFVRLGALSVKAGAAGQLRFDAFESRRTSYIGPCRD